MDTELKDILVNMQSSILSIGVKLDRMEERIDRIEERIDRIEERLDRMEYHMGNLDARVSGLESDMETMKSHMISVENRLVSLENGQHSLEERLTSLELNVKETRIILEHEINRKITALYDGREDELRYRDLIIVHDNEIRDIIPRLHNIEISYTRHLAKYHTS